MHVFLHLIVNVYVHTYLHMIKTQSHSLTLQSWNDKQGFYNEKWKTKRKFSNLTKINVCF